MPHIIAIEKGEAQRRQLSEKISELEKSGWPLTGKYEADNFKDWKNLFENILAPGLFTQKEVIIIESAEILGNFPDLLISAIEDKNADCNLILLFNSDLKSLKNIKSKIEIIAPEPAVSPWGRKKWLEDLAKQNNIKISDDAINLLSDNIESQEELRSELNKLFIFSNGKEIKISDVQNLSFDEGGQAQLKFLDGVCDYKIFDVASSLKYLRKNPVMIILTALTNRLRPAMMLACFPNDKDEALKSIGLNPAKKYALMKANNALRNYGAENIKKFMMKAVKLSYLEKTNYSEGWPGFEIILWELIMKL